MHRTIRRNIALLPLLVLATLAAPFTGCSSSNSTQAGTAQVLDPTQPHYGNTDAEWGALCRQWVYQLPQSTDDAGMPDCNIPFQDPTGAHCTDGQSGDVFFLAGASGGTVERDQCAVPSGKAIFFPIFNFVADNGGVPPAMQLSDSALMGQVQTGMAGVSVGTLSAEFDGLPIANLASFATPVTQYKYTLPPEPNVYTCEGETGVTGPVSPSYAAGYYIMLPPPAPGAHVLHFAGTSTTSNPHVMVDVTYRFTIH